LTKQQVELRTEERSKIKFPRLLFSGVDFDLVKKYARVRLKRLILISSRNSINNPLCAGIEVDGRWHCH
jgi:hypothetical protein